MAIISLEKFKAAAADYLSELERKLRSGVAREHAYRPALQRLLEAIDPSLNVINEPARTEIGQPDFIVSAGLFPKGYVEAKDIGVDLEAFEKTDQFTRYLGLQNLITTDYLEFRWYVLEHPNPAIRIGWVNAKNRIDADAKGIEQLYGMLIRFSERPVPPVRNPKELASRMAALAKNMVAVIQLALKKEGEYGSIHQKLAGFREVLLPDLTEDQFADMYAQTIVYGFFAARCNHKGKKDFSTEKAGSEVPKTNPFLRRMFATFSEEDDTLADEGIEWLINDLVDLLRVAELEDILLNFGARTRQQDPVLHFYETFLVAYNPALREKRGVYYTPEPVVSYIVRSVDHLLRQEFDISDGLGGTEKVRVKHDDTTEEIHRVIILDPAAGTGTFLHEVIREIHRNLFEDNAELWSSYVSEHLLPRLFGFELLMAPYAVAHMKLGLQLQDLGYDFKSNERLQVYLTNALEEAGKGDTTIPFAQWLADEANAAGDVKLNKPVMVVLGNPPYSGHSANASYRRAREPETGKMKRTVTWIGGLLQDYYMVDGKPLGEKNPKWLQDDYVKFFRFAQEKVKSTGYGIVAMITNNGFLDNPTFRGMRQSLLNSFEKIYVLDLHGNSKKREKTAEGGKDENVFDIMQGVTITLCVRTTKIDTRKAIIDPPCQVFHADLLGLRREKYEYLRKKDVTKTKWKRHTPKGPLYLFAPQDNRLEADYVQYAAYREIFNLILLGPISCRNDFAVAFSNVEATQRKTEFFDKGISDLDLRKKYDLKDNRDWKLHEARKSTQSGTNPVLALFRPFDFRYMLYGEYAYDYPRQEINNALLGGSNLALITTRQTKEAFSALVTSSPVAQHKLVTAYDGSYVAPLYLYKADTVHNLFEGKEQDSSFNFNKDFLAQFGAKLGVQFGSGKKSFPPEDVFNYIYAVLYSPTYRARYVNFLKHDFPRIPLTSNIGLFKKLSELGSELIAYHTMKKKAKSDVKLRGKGTHEVTMAAYEPTDRNVFINKNEYFEGVSPEVWEFKMGGYQVAQKWLKDRKERTLTYDDLQHYIHTLAALKETMRFMKEIDTVIGQHGGWPIK